MDNFSPEHIIITSLIVFIATWMFFTFRRSLITREEFYKEITDLKIKITKLTVIVEENSANKNKGINNV